HKLSVTDQPTTISLIRGHRTAHSSNYSDLAHHQVSSQTWEPLIAIFRPAILNGGVLMFDIGLR
ncbi:MAG TPA: hypothetical protein VFO15_17410, partial [Xanthobacteraceae bacterium]|nr:hypothetical protein [Xanthobacteraceae bacterium]